MNVWDFLTYTEPSQEIEVHIKPMQGSRYVRFVTDIWDEIKNCDYEPYLRAVTLVNFYADKGIIYVFGIEE